MRRSPRTERGREKWSCGGDESGWIVAMESREDGTHARSKECGEKSDTAGPQRVAPRPPPLRSGKATATQYSRAQPARAAKMGVTYEVVRWARRLAELHLWVQPARMARRVWVSMVDRHLTVVAHSSQRDALAVRATKRRRRALLRPHSRQRQRRWRRIARLLIEGFEFHHVTCARPRWEL